MEVTNMADYKCLSCKWFDSKYKSGYCDYHKAETTPSNSCDKHKN